MLNKKSNNFRYVMEKSLQNACESPRTLCMELSVFSQFEMPSVANVIERLIETVSNKKKAPVS